VSTVALTGGGTAGHITPLLAVGEEIRARHPGLSLLVIGSEQGRERDLLPDGFAEVIDIPKLPFPRSINRDALAFPGRFSHSVSLLRDEFLSRGVSVVAGFGGYVAAPAYVAAWQEKIPLVIHEANMVPGLANRLGARFTKRVASCFPGTPLAHAVSIGMPLPQAMVNMDRSRLALEGHEFFGTNPDKPVLLITGGSSGARKLNEVVFAKIPDIVARGWQVLHLVGPALPIPEGMPRGYVPLSYCRRMDLAYSVADLVVSRAGAATVSELAIAGLPAILVPYHVGNGEQEKNARYLVDAGAAVMVRQKDFTGAYIDSVVLPLLDDAPRREQMARLAKKQAVSDAAERFADMVVSAIPGGR